jgi:predicted nucleic acid-binding protein
MAESVLVDAGFVVALLSRRDTHHRWAASQARRFAPPWKTCEAALSESFHLLGLPGSASLVALLRRGALVSVFDLGDHLDDVLRLIEKYRDVPASLADACLIRMTETLAQPVVLTTDMDFRVYRRHGRQVVPAVMPVQPHRRGR